MIIGVISDTHGVLRDDVIDRLSGCDYIIHAGDIGSEDIIKKLQEIAVTIAVKGNNDLEDWTKSLNEREKINIGGKSIFIIHEIKRLPRYVDNVDVVIYGHSHKYSLENEGDIIFFNPGSCGKKRFSLPLTMGIITIKDEKIKIEKIDID
ncbi:metallophosphoesterase family protein [Clostridium sp.]|uniref:metallophosphoesterase family protein n=1 Tax=Clostridium sp. TaxID=1506 RepID=UPI003F3EAF54